MILFASHPYQGAQFFSFFAIFFSRMASWIFGGLSFGDLVTDEIQVLSLSCVAVSCALIGCPLVLRRRSMLANSLSHTVLLGVVAAYALLYRGSAGSFSLLAQFIAALISALITVLLTEFFTRVARVREDAANGLVFSTLFALGIVLATLLTRNSHLGIETVMGSADALHPSDLFPSAAILGFNGLLITLLYKEYQSLSFDPGFSKAAGLFPGLTSYVMMLQLALTAVSAFRFVGVILVLAFIVVPALGGRLLARSLCGMLCVSALISFVSVFLGVAAARHFLSQWNMPLSTAGVVTCTLVVVYGGILAGYAMRRRWSLAQAVEPVGIDL